MTEDKLNELLDRHRIWVESSGKEGSKATLIGVDLRGAKLGNAKLRGANLASANLCNADLHNADLRDAILCDANLCGADLGEAHLQGSDLRGANLRDARLPAKTFVIIGEEFHVQISNGDHLRAGCQSHYIDEWRRFDRRDYLEMDGQRAARCQSRMYEILDFYLGQHDHSDSTAIPA